MIKQMVICLNYGYFKNKLRSVIVSQNHYLNKIFDVHPLLPISEVSSERFCAQPAKQSFFQNSFGVL